jgi:hypothetical protein
LALAFVSKKGTNFEQANLANADFTEAVLKNANFYDAMITRTCWSRVKMLDRASVEKTILIHEDVRKLMITGQGENQSYIGCNLKGANLSAANLINADLTEADISNATLKNANLRGAFLNKTQALGADFRGANLTEACIEAWNIDATTILEDALCECIYLLKEPNIYGNRERRPSSHSFAPGEFTKLFQEVLSTIDLIFQDEIDWKAFVTAFKKIQVQNPDTELTIQSIENKGDGVVVVKVNAPLDANKEKIHSEFKQNYEEALKALEAKYQAELQAKDREIVLYREKSAEMKEIIRLLAQRPVNVEVNANAESKAMQSSSDQSRNFNNVDITASYSVVNLGDISGNVTNTIRQLQDSSQPNTAELSDRLKQLKSAIETESELKDDDKAEALEQVNILAQAGQNPQDSTLKKVANTALKILKGTIAALTPTAAIVKACSELLPVIAKLLGL